jgi:hypothetical protein
VDGECRCRSYSRAVIKHGATVQAGHMSDCIKHVVLDAIHKTDQKPALTLRKVDRKHSVQFEELPRNPDVYFQSAGLLKKTPDSPIALPLRQSLAPGWRNPVAALRPRSSVHSTDAFRAQS